MTPNLQSCPLTDVEDARRHYLTIDEDVSGSAVRYIIECSCGIRYTGQYGDAGSVTGPRRIRDETIAKWNSRSWIRGMSPRL